MQSTPQTRGPGRSRLDVDASVRGLFRDYDGVNRAVRGLTAKSVPVDSIRVFVLDEKGNRRREVRVEDEAGTLKGALIGAAAGAVLGLLLVVLIPLGVLGPANVDLFGMATLVGALRAIAICAVAGLPLGAILGMGHWTGRKKIAEEELSRGRVEVAVESEQLATLARGVLLASGGELIE